MEVVAVLRKLTEPEVRAPLSPGSRRWLWILTVANVTTVAWMLTLGDWLDATSRLTSVVTLGGHHQLVLWLAVVGFAILATIAPMTGGFAEVTRPQAAVIAVAGAVSVVALAGVLSVVALVVGAVLLVALLGRAFVR